MENSIYQAEKMPDEYKDKISDEDKEAIKKAVEEAKKSKDSEDKDELEKAVKALNGVTMPIGEKMYKQAAEAEKKSADGNKTDDKKSDEPVEGEVVKDKKK